MKLGNEVGGPELKEKKMGEGGGVVAIYREKPLLIFCHLTF